MKAEAWGALGSSSLSSMWHPGATSQRWLCADLRRLPLFAGEMALCPV